jgi:hypothetical protein
MTRPPTLVQSQLVQAAGDDDYLFFVLGLVAFATAFLDALGEGRATIRDPATPTGSPADDPGSLLI